MRRVRLWMQWRRWLKQRNAELPGYEMLKTAEMVLAYPEPTWVPSPWPELRAGRPQ